MPTPSAGRAAVVGLLLALSLAVAGCGDDTSAAPAATDPAPTPVTASAGPPPDPTAAAADAASAFAAFALDDVRDVPWAEEVVFSIASTEVARLDLAEADRPASWRGCPDPPYGVGGVYEGRDCPVSPLRTLNIGDDLDEGLVQETLAPETVGCTTYRSPARDSATVWLRPGLDARSCFADYAVAISVDDDGRVTGVDLAVSGP